MISSFFAKDTTAKVLFILYIILFIVCAINPYARNVWFAENLTVLAVVATLVILYACNIRFSPLSYALMSIFIFIHTIGGHYTFERVPFGAISEFFGFGRNNYDRMGHFAVGFYAYPIAEILYARGLITKKWLAVLFGIVSIGAIAAWYEIFEWWYAISSDPTAGAAVLGSQGDIWDAQKDMLSDTLGALVSGLSFYFFKKTK